MQGSSFINMDVESPNRYLDISWKGSQVSVLYHSLSLKCKISAIWLGETCVFLKFSVQISMECEAH